MSEKSEKIHDAGVERHASDWLPANMRAIDGATLCGLTPYTSPGREAIPRIILCILDGLKVEAGMTWDKEAKIWKPRTPPANEDKAKSSVAELHKVLSDLWSHVVDMGWMDADCDSQGAQEIRAALEKFSPPANPPFEKP